jgi:hypothetical protein
MKISTIAAIAVLILSFTCAQNAWSQASIQRSGPGWTDAGFIERASVFVTGNPLCLGKNPWINQPDVYTEKPLDHITLEKGWNRLSVDSAASLPSGTKIAIVIASCGDDRWTSYGAPETKVTAGRIVINISMQRDDSPHIKNYMPSLRQQRITLEKLAKGVYEVYLHSTLAGRISIP